MEKIIFTAGILLLPAVCTTVGAAGAFLFRRAQEPRTQRMTSGMAAGIMLAASVWSLLLPAIERAERGVWPGWFPPTAGLVVGAVGLLRLEALAGRWFAAGPGHCGHMVLAVTLHNLPEGMAIGSGASHDAQMGLTLAVLIALHNIPEGMSIGVPLIAGGMAKWKAVLLTALSGAPTLVGGALGAYLGSGGDALVAISLALAAGAMLYVTYCEILPQVILLNQERGPAVFTIMGIILGLLMVHAL